MEAKVSFKLAQGASERRILATISCGLYKIKGDKKVYDQLILPTGLRIRASDWSKKVKSKFKAKGDPHINDHLKIYEENVVLVVRKLTKDKSLSNANIKLELERIYNPSEDSPASNLNDYIKNYVDAIENGTRLTEKGLKFTPGTIKQFRTFERVFQLFQKHQKKTYSYDDITIGFYKAYTSFLISVEVRDNKKVVKAKYSPNTVGSHVKRLKMIMRAAREEGLHANVFIDSKKFKVISETSHQIYLNDAEVRAIYNLELSDKMDEIRDVFLAGCYTAQRFSDYSKIKKSNFRGNFLYLTQQKTKNEVVIPIKPELKSILLKYDYTLPYIYEAQLNENIKLIARMAGITQPIVFNETKGGVVTEQTKEKCALVSSHTARRSGCTNLHIAGVNTLDIMKISGHKSEKELLNYIRVNAEDSAKKVSTAKWFTQEYKPLRIAK